MLNSVCYDVCNLSEIYTTTYQYFLPSDILIKFFNGTAFQGAPYSNEELENLCTDINELYQNILATKPPRKGGTAIISAGAPGSGKTTKLREELAWNHKGDRYHAIICPEDICLPNMKRTYKKDLGENTSQAHLKKTYDKWISGAHAAAHFILAFLIKNNYDFFYGTSLSYPMTANLLKFIKLNGYSIRIIYVVAPNQLCFDSIVERKKPPYDISLEEIKKKAAYCALKIVDTYFQYASEVDFCCRENARSKTIVGAVWKTKKDYDDNMNRLYIFNTFAYEKIKELHNSAISKYESVELMWENSIEIISTVVHALDSPGRCRDERFFTP